MLAKNIVIFSDGTGQRAGLTFDERRTNIYKLFRATRCGPDTRIDPETQVTFYDGGIGTVAPGTGTLGAIASRIYNLICQATGLGLTTNLVECYAAILRVWEPGDRIFLFGFSRGAYTMRLLGGVLSHCGVPTRQPERLPLWKRSFRCVRACLGKRPPKPDFEALSIDEKGSKRIARRAVRRVYQHSVSKIGTREDPLSSRELKFKRQRELLAAEFREQHGSGSNQPKGESNTVPHFIGVFDTVASINHRRAMAAVAFVGLALLAILSLAGAYLGLAGPMGLEPRCEPEIAYQCTLWYRTFHVFTFSLLCLSVIGALRFLKFPGPIWSPDGKESFSCRETIHMTSHMHFDDNTLSKRVPYARHAVAIDENRKLFKPILWSRDSMTDEVDEHGVRKYHQVWFAGVHSDIGGGYPETESRLSDAALKWMLEDVYTNGIGLDVNWPSLNLSPSPNGRQHDEYKSRWVWRFGGKKLRIPGPEDALHDSVRERYLAGPVPHYDRLHDYRPPGLAGDPKQKIEPHPKVAVWTDDTNKPPRRTDRLKSRRLPA